MELNKLALSTLDAICVGDKKSNRQAILDYEEKAKKLPQVKIPVKHIIHGGMYARQITIPKGVLLTGQIYKFDHMDIMISGDITVSTDGGEVVRLKGFNTFEGLSGKKRAGYAHEDTTWITVHPYAFSEDGEEIQSFITAESFEDLDKFNGDVNRADYNQMLIDTGFNEQEVRKQSELKDDQIDMPVGYESVYTSNSKIEGVGLFSNKQILKNSVICPSRLIGKRTPAGRYTNHAMFPNAKMIILNSGDVDLVAIKDISPNEEITINYKQVLNHRLVEGDLCQE